MRIIPMVIILALATVAQGATSPPTTHPRALYTASWPLAAGNIRFIGAMTYQNEFGQVCNCTNCGALGPVTIIERGETHILTGVEADANSQTLFIASENFFVPPGCVTNTEPPYVAGAKAKRLLPHQMPGVLTMVGIMNTDPKILAKYQDARAKREWIYPDVKPGDNRTKKSRHSPIGFSRGAHNRTTAKKMPPKPPKMP